MDLTQSSSDDEANEEEAMMRIVNDRDNVANPSIEREIRETSPYLNPLHHNNVSYEEATTPLPSSQVIFPV